MIFVFTFVQNEDLSSKIWTVHNLNTQPDCKSTCGIYNRKCEIKEFEPQLKFYCKQCAVQAHPETDNLREKIVKRVWTIRTYNRHPRCRETCERHKLYCVRVSHDPLRFGCDTKTRQYHKKNQKPINTHQKRKQEQNRQAHRKGIFSKI